MKLPKFINLFSDGEPEKHRQTVPPSQQVDAKLEKARFEIEKLSTQVQKSQKELAQAKAQLQINQGFQIELGETQLRLQQVEAELQHYKKSWFEQQKQFSHTQTKLQEVQQTLAKSQSWLAQIKTPVKLIAIEKTLPKQDFETLWGFGIITPTVESVITTGAILVKGWVLGKKATAQTLRVKYQDECLLETPVELHRPVIMQQYPDIPAANKSGFEFSLAVVNISSATELSLEATLADKTVVPLCNFTLEPIPIESKDT